MSLEKNMPWIALGVGVLTVGGVLLYARQANAALPSGPKGVSKQLPPGLAIKVRQQIAATRDPEKLKNLAAGLQQQGATKEALDALTKAASITGKPEQVPGALGLPETIITPGGQAAAVSAPGVSQYRVASGDIPGAIAKRFGVGLAQIARANGANGKRIMGGQIRAGETLALPPGSVDSGPQKRATGVAS